MDRKKVHILWLFSGIIMIGILVSALEVGDDSECSNNEMIISDNDIWTCSDNLSITGINPEINLTIDGNLTVKGSLFVSGQIWYNCSTNCVLIQ